MAGGVSIGMIGGSPLMKAISAAGKVTGNRLPLTKALDGGGGLGGLMSSVIRGGGLQALAANPMAAIGGQLQGAISGAVGSLGSLAGAAGLVSALTGPGGLSGAVGGLLSAGGGLLSGQGVLGMIAHANIAEMAGAALPGNLGIDTVLGPLTSGDLLGQVTDWVPQMAADVLAGALPIQAAIAQVEGHVATIEGIVNASAHALSTVEALAPDIAAVSTMAASFIAAPAEIVGVLEQALPPDVVVLMRESVAGHMAPAPD
ncbi:hypothetical protein [Methylobacterium hispanicum]|uniref:hypothetical protein n=1 Tax=Methylobacterium hispanicum TaxID=270350 RepID=UPI002F2FD70E